MTFTPRLDTTGMENSLWWYSSGNPFYLSNYGLPNCTCYAYGRYAEIRGAFAKLPTGNAGDWYDRAKSAFPVSDKPALGAVACWKAKPGTNYSGHVGIVEQIFPDGSFLTSNSAWKGTYFFTYKCTGKNYQGLGWMKSRDYQFCGFILQTENDKSLPSGQWHAKNSGGYSRQSAQARDNAIKIYREMTEKYNWSLSAVCGLLGNIEAECSYNFWQWENGIIAKNSPLQDSTRNNAYGFVQWTPASGYTRTKAYQDMPGFGVNYSDSPGKLTDAEVQLYAIVAQKEGTQWLPSAPMARQFNYLWTWKEYQTTDASPEDCAFAFMVEYERPYIGAYNSKTKTYNPTAIESSAHLSRRKEAARYWYDYFSGFSVETPPGGIITEEPANENIPPDPSQPEKPDETDGTPHADFGSGTTPEPQNPVTVTGAHARYKAKWTAKSKGGYERISNEALNNACCLFNILYFNCKWTISAISALLGAIEVLSGYNPWKWMGDNIQPSFVLGGDTESGWEQRDNLKLLTNETAYGLIQFSPPSGYFDNARDYNSFSPNFRNPEYEIKEMEVLGVKIYFVLFTGYVYTGTPDDGESQCYYINDLLSVKYPDFRNMYTADFEWMIQGLSDKDVIRGLTPDEMAQARAAALYWYHKFHGTRYNYVIYNTRRKYNRV